MQHSDHGVREQIRSNLAFRIRFYDYRQLIWVFSHQRSIDCFN